MRLTEGAPRRFLFLQGPHGPFFRQLAAALSATGAEVWRVGFNFGDEALWRPCTQYLPCHAPPEAWPALLAQILGEKQITDLVLYGDTRPIHALALARARAMGLRCHIFEEGYLRPSWITYETEGANGHAPLAAMDLSALRAARAALPPAPLPPRPPARWGDLRAHMFWGALYHGLVLWGAKRYPAFRPHRDLSAGAEARLYLRRALGFLPRRWQRWRISRRIARGGFPYFVVLLQLAHDESFRRHSPFPSMVAFLDHVLTAFAEGAPPYTHLVFKTHPLEDGRLPLKALIRGRAAALGLTGRVHFLPGGPLAPLLDGALGAVTVNSTAGQQALWRGLPLFALGRAVYAKKGLTSGQSLPSFFAAPEPPDPAAYADLRAYLLATSQIPGGFYAAKARALALRGVLPRLLAAERPVAATAAGPQHLHILR